MKLQDLLKDLELGKVYTDKDRKPFKVNEKASYEPYKQIGTNKNDGYILHGKDIPVEEDKNPCWKGYKQVGMKEKDGRQVPNCVPIDEIDEGKVNQSKVNQAFTRAVASIRKISRKLNDDDNYAFIQKLEKWLR